MKLSNIAVKENEQRQDVNAEKTSMGKGTNERDVTMTGVAGERRRCNES
jgi:hypothetical protein